jgi:hypothetical protein
MTRLFLASGGAVFALLGIVHGVLALRDIAKPRTFTPPDEQLRAAMKASPVAIHPTANLWRAWLGFNLSHSLGVTVFGGTLAAIAVANVASYQHSVALRIAAPLIGATYMVLARLFWFRDPLIGTSIGTLLLAAASLLS